MVGYMPNTIAEPKYRLVAVATSERVHVFAEPYLVDTLTELFNLVSSRRYVLLLGDAGPYRVVAIQDLLWQIRPDWNRALPGVINAIVVENSEGFATLDQAITYLSSELHNAEVMYLTQKNSTYIAERMAWLVRAQYTKQYVREVFETMLYLWSQPNE